MDIFFTQKRQRRCIRKRILHYPYKPSTPLVITLYLLKRREINIEVLDERAGNIQRNPNQGNITREEGGVIGVQHDRADRGERKN